MAGLRRDSTYRRLYTLDTVLAPLRFLWNATRGSRLRPWRSEYLRWRMETYSGQWADKMRARDILGFVWTSRWELLSFLFWTGRVEREARRKS
jgi:hypothetical protein